MLELILITVKVRKPVSKLLGIGTFLLLLILKGAFPKAAYAFVPSPGMSTLDTCAAQPACRAALGSELAPAIATPTAEGVASTITASTATGVSTTTQAAAGVAVVGDMRLSGIAAYYLWSRGVNGQAQEIARQRYCAAYPKDVVCGPFTGGQSPVYYYVYAVRNGVEYVLHWTDQYDTPLPVLGPITNIVPNGSWGWYGQTYGHEYLVYDANGNLVGNKPLISKEYTFELIGTVPNPPTIVRRVDGQPDTLGNPPPLPWKDWSQEKRSIAVAALTPADWQGFITSMPVGGRLIPGDQVNAPGGIIIPGQPEDDPNTPADERLLRKDQGFKGRQVN